MTPHDLEWDPEARAGRCRACGALEEPETSCPAEPDAGWTSTGRRLPAVDGSYLVWVFDRHEIASWWRSKYLQDSHWTFGSAEWRHDTPSHWRALPEAP